MIRHCLSTGCAIPTGMGIPCWAGISRRAEWEKYKIPWQMRPWQIDLHVGVATSGGLNLGIRNGSKGIRMEKFGTPSFRPSYAHSHRCRTNCPLA